MNEICQSMCGFRTLYNKWKENENKQPLGDFWGGQKEQKKYIKSNKKINTIISTYYTQSQTINVISEMNWCCLEEHHSISKPCPSRIDQPVLARCVCPPLVGLRAAQRLQRPETGWNLQSWAAGESAAGRWWWAPPRLLVYSPPLRDARWVVLMSGEGWKGVVTAFVVSKSKMMPITDKILFLLVWEAVVEAQQEGKLS